MGEFHTGNQAGQADSGLSGQDNDQNHSGRWGIPFGNRASAVYRAADLTGITEFSLVGGTSLLIVVGVALETMQAIESHLLMRHYEGFIK